MTPARHASSVLQAVSHFLADPDVEIDPLGIRPGREVYLCRGRSETVVAKWYPDLGKALAAARAHSALGGPHGSLRCPRLLYLDEEHCTLLQEHLDGTPVFAALGGARTALMNQVGTAIADLHSLDVYLPTRLTRTAALQNASTSVSELDGAWRQLGEDMVSAAERLLGESSPAEYLPCHGDLGWAQMVDLGTELGLVDLDHASMAEAGLDAGNLIVQLLRRHPDAMASVGDLLDAYGRRRFPLERASVFGYALVVAARKLLWVGSTRRPEIAAAATAIMDVS